jgi:hypothetical protein
MKMSSGMLRRVVWWKLTDLSEVLAAFVIVRMMGAVSTSETSVNFYQTKRHNIPEGINLDMC